MPKAKRKKSKAIKANLKKYKYSKYYETVAVDERLVLYRPNKSANADSNLTAVFKELIENEKYSNLEHIWLITDSRQMENEILGSYVRHEKVKFIKAGSLKGMEALAKAKYILYDNIIPMFFIKKEAQICINLWSEIPLKKMGVDQNTKLNAQIWNTQKNFYACDYLVSPNQYTTDKILNAFNLKGLFDGKIVEAGFPKKDLILETKKERVIERLEKQLGVSLKKRKIILYTPEARRIDGKLIDSSRMIKNHLSKLSKELPEDYMVITKLEPADYDSVVKKKIELLLLPNWVTEYEMAALADVLIADYGNLFFSFLSVGKPVIFFDYDRERSNIDKDAYLKPEQLPGRVCSSVKQVVLAVREIENGTYQQDTEDNNFIDQYLPETKNGSSTSEIVEAIFGEKKQKNHVRSFESEKKKILLHTGVFNNITDRELCFCILKNIDYNKYVVAVDGNDIYTYQKEFAKINDTIRIVNSRYENNKTFFEKKYLKDSSLISEEKYKKLFQREFKSMYGGIKFDIIIDMVGKKTVWMNVFSSLEGVRKVLMVNQKNDTETVLQEYEKYMDDITVINGEGALNGISNKIHCVAKEDFLQKSGLNPLNVLFISAFDSTNYVFVNLIKELTARGHSCTVIVKDKDDVINNKMYIQEDIPFIEVDEYDMKLVSVVDFVFSAPLKYDCYNSLYKKINASNKFIITFASLFSSIVMGVNPDLSLSLGKSKFDEFRENGLKYNLVAIGNPQYDRLIELRQQREAKDLSQIKKVLMIEQGAYPFGQKGKTQLADVLCHIARMNPQITFTVKPRYLPSEKGKQLHVLSEHVYDFIQDKPDNLILLKEPVVLEDIIQDFDAAMTTWSTAYLDAAVLGLPMILIEGFDSIDVYNVRNQRIDAAYDRLRHSGCVVHFEELYKEKALPFRYVDEKYLGEELYEPESPCVPRVMELLEFLYEKLIITDKRWKTIHQLEFSEFFNRFDEIPLIEVGSCEYRSRKRLFSETNRILQKFIFENRCMGQVLDVEPVYQRWDYEVSEETAREEITEAIRTLNQLTDEIKSEFFTRHFDLVCQDRILQDYYFQWLFMKKKYQEILNYQGTLICPESLYFYRAVILYKKRHYKNGTKYMAQFFEISANKECKDLRKDMSISAYLWKGRLGKYLILYYLDRYQAYDVIQSIDKENVIYQKDIMLYYRVKSFVKQGMNKEAVDLCDEYSQLMFKKTKSKSIKTRVKYFVGKIFYKKAEALVQKAENAAQK